MHLPGPTYILSPFSPGVRGMVMYQKTRKIARICRQRQRGREGGRERAGSPRKRFPLWGNKGRAIQNIFVPPLFPPKQKNRRTQNITLYHFCIVPHIHTHTHTYIHTHLPEGAVRDQSSRDWLTYVYVYVCVYACQHPSLPPGGPSLKIGPQSEKEKKTTSPFLLAHNI